MNSQSMKAKLEKAIQFINNNPLLEREEVANLFIDIIKEYNSLTRTDFLNDRAFNRYKNTRATFIKNNILNKELSWLQDRTDMIFTSDNYFQTKATILTMLIPFND